MLKWALLAATALGCSIALPVDASAQTAQTTSTLEEVIVTARRSEERLQDVPIAITAFSAESLASTGTRDPRALANQAPSLTINPNIYKHLPYRPLEDFDPISLAAASPFLMVVHPSLRVATLAELVALAKSGSASLNYSSPGNGSLHQLAMEWFKCSTGAMLIHVPYKGSQSINAVIAGEVSVTFASVVGMLPHVKSGRVKAIAITSRERFRLVPELPTVAESGVPGFEATNWFGILAPHGTSRAIVTTIGSNVAGQMKSADVKDRFLNDGAEPIGGTADEFTALIRQSWRAGPR